MRRVVLVAASMMLASCAAPQSDGGLWARQGLQQELVLSRLTDAQRAAAAHEFELLLADQALNQEQARIEAALEQCPRQQQPASDQTRDSIRGRIADDSARQARLAQQAQADAWLQRAAASGSAEECQQAKLALTAPPPPPEPFDPAAQTQLVEHALGWADTAP